MADEFLIWSEEHGRWWKPAERGYTSQLATAGRYSRERAEAIVRSANFGSAFNEIAVPVPEGLDALIRRGSPFGHEEPAEHVDERASQLQERINGYLAQLAPTATEEEFATVLAPLVPEGWEWVEATSLGGPRQIRFTRYTL